MLKLGQKQAFGPDLPTENKCNDNNNEKDGPWTLVLVQELTNYLTIAMMFHCHPPYLTPPVSTSI